MSKYLKYFRKNNIFSSYIHIYVYDQWVQHLYQEPDYGRSLICNKEYEFLFNYSVEPLSREVT